MSDPNWTTTTGIGGIWQSGDALFGNVPSTENGDFDFATFPPADTVRDDYDLWVRRSVDFSAFDIATAVRELGVDIGFLLYANGVFIDGDNREHFTERGEYSGDFGSALVPGENVIAVAVDDFGLLTAFDMRITAEAATILPLPSGLPLLLGGLGGLELLRRRRS